MVAKDEFTNLRYFIKVRNFIDEVINELREDVFTEKFTKRNLYRICYSVVIFVSKDEGKRTRLPNPDSGEYLTDVGYINEYILNGTPTNTNLLDMILTLLNWYEKGNLLSEELVQRIDITNRTKSDNNKYFWSYEEIKASVNQT